jgi:hypothetical protein
MQGFHQEEQKMNLEVLSHMGFPQIPPPISFLESLELMDLASGTDHHL